MTSAHSSESQKSSLDLMKREIEGQPEGLASYWEKLSTIPVSVDPSNLVFAGSGDSYSAALWAQELSSGKARACDPSELVLEPSRAKGKDLVILSVSGKTKSNLSLAESVRGIARRRIAIVASEDSPLAKKCDETRLLEYYGAGGQTAGTASYTSTILACSQLTGHLPKGNIKESLRSALGRAAGGTLPLRKDGVSVFVGSGLDYPLGTYGGLKMNEVLGMKSIYCTPEQLVHAIIFSLDKEKDTIVMINPSSSQRFQEIDQAMVEERWSTCQVNANVQHPVLRSLEVAFHLQYLAYNLAVEMGLFEVAYLSNRDALDLSSRLIY